jgi:hypothetical protein
MNKFEIPDWYCTNIHASLKIELNQYNGKFSVSTCARTPVLFDVIDNRSFDHPELVNFRKTNLETKTLSERCSLCLGCQTCENRNSSNDLYINDELLINQKGPKLITFLISRICNLACATCQPSLSSKWAAISNKPNSFYSADADSLRELIRNLDVNNLETVHIFGGEPFADSINDVILEELADHGKNITVWYDTNGTFIPSDHTMRLWEKFHLVRIKFSIDGVEDSFEYLRWPAKWETVKKNIIKIKQTCPSNVMFGARPAIGFLNLHKVRDIRDWFLADLATNREGDLSEFEYNGVYGIFGARNMPEKMRDDLLEIYPIHDPVMRIINSWTKPPPGNILEEVKLTLANIDRFRKTDYQKSLSYITQYLT